MEAGALGRVGQLVRFGTEYRSRGGGSQLGAGANWALARRRYFEGGPKMVAHRKHGRFF